MVAGSPVGEEVAIKRVVVIGAGLAGLAAASALAERGFQVHLLERKSVPGGRASSYEAQDTGEPVDNCQHILMRCCTNLLHFYGGAGVQERIRWTGHLHFLEPNGRQSILSGSRLPAPFHLMPSFFRLRFLTAADKWATANALMRMLRSAGPKPDVPMIEWLRQTGQTRGAIERFWRPILVSALNEEPERCSARYAFQIFRQGFLAHPRAYEMGVPAVPLRELYDPCVEALERWGAVVRFRCPVRQLRMEGERVAAVQTADGSIPADYVVCAVPFDGVGELLPGAAASDPFWRRWERMTVSPISAVHLWWDRPVTPMRHAALLDRQVQWMFNKTQDFARSEGGTYMGLVVSASRDWLPRSRREILETAEAEVRQAFPGTAGAEVVKSAVIKEAKATFSAVPGIDEMRPPAETPIRNLFLAGDWVQSGWPATMEGAVRSGYGAAERILAAESRRPEESSVLVPDLPWQSVLGKPQ
jgi:squalene-associated FAD-dependent desaturase